jgi:hypothetical protein
MGKTSYENMSDLSKKLNDKIAEIESGDLELSDLEGVVSDSRELYERLLILKHKAYEQIEHPSETEKEKTIVDVVEEEEEVKEEEEPTLDFSGITEESEEEEQPSFDFTADEESETEESNEPTIEIPKEEPSKEDKEDLFKDSHVEKHEPEDENTLNEKLKEEEELSLRKKLQSTAVSDLKSEISIAKKFEYITFMFEGKNESYNDAIEVLNNCVDGDDARVKLNEYSSKYNWDLENKSIIKFVELVERRYL